MNFLVEVLPESGQVQLDAALSEITVKDGFALPKRTVFCELAEFVGQVMDGSAILLQSTDKPNGSEIRIVWFNHHALPAVRLENAYIMREIVSHPLGVKRSGFATASRARCPGHRDNGLFKFHGSLSPPCVEPAPLFAAETAAPIYQQRVRLSQNGYGFPPGLGRTVLITHSHSSTPQNTSFVTTCTQVLYTRDQCVALPQPNEPVYTISQIL
jgi:hypothetical protein